MIRGERKEAYSLGVEPLWPAMAFPSPPLDLPLVVEKHVVPVPRNNGTAPQHIKRQSKTTTTEEHGPLLGE